MFEQKRKKWRYDGFTFMLTGIFFSTLMLGDWTLAKPYLMNKYNIAS
jgi:hypothetical protein